MLSVGLLEPYLLVKHELETQKELQDALEPKNVVDTKGEKVSYIPVSPSWLGDEHITRTLQHDLEQLVNAIYTFFRSFDGSPYDMFPDWDERARRPR